MPVYPLILSGKGIYYAHFITYHSPNAITSKPVFRRVINNQPIGEYMTDTTTATLPPQGMSRINDLLPFLPISKSTIWRMVKAGKFPKPIRLSSQCTVWKNSDVLAWIDNQGASDA